MKAGFPHLDRCVVTTNGAPESACTCLFAPVTPDPPVKRTGSGLSRAEKRMFFTFFGSANILFGAAAVLFGNIGPVVLILAIDSVIGLAISLWLISGRLIK